MTRAERAKELFKEGYNCAQATLLAFAEDLGTDEAFLRAVGAPMGGGMGRMRLTCGAVSGAVLAMGLLFPEMPKPALYAAVQEFAERFREKNGSIICGELLAGAGVPPDRAPVPERRTETYYKKRPCAELVADAAELLETMCRERGRL